MHKRCIPTHTSSAACSRKRRAADVSFLADETIDVAAHQPLIDSTTPCPAPATTSSASLSLLATLPVTSCQVATNSTCNNINTRQMVLPCTTSITTGFGEKPILSFETRSRIVFFQSRASRRERDFVHRISSLETRSRILFTESRASRRDREFCSPNLEIRDEIEIFRSFYQNILVRKKDFSHKRSNITVQLEEEGS